MKEDASRRANATIKKRNGEVRFIRRVAKKLGASFPLFFFFVLSFLFYGSTRVDDSFLVSDFVQITFSFREDEIPVETASFSISNDDHRQKTG